MANNQTSYLKFSKGSERTFLFLLILWVASQLLSIWSFLPLQLFWTFNILRNIFGAILVAWSFLFILGQFLQHRVIVINTTLFIFALMFPVYVTLINIVTNRLSWNEVALYWLWITGVYLVFPAMLNQEDMRRKAINVIFWTNLAILLLGVLLGILTKRYYLYGHGDRIVFSFLHPNFYCNSWQIVFAIAFYYTLTVKRKKLIIAASFLAVCSVIFMLLAVSRNTLVASMILIVIYVLLNEKWSSVLKYILGLFILFSILVAFLLIEPSASKIDRIGSGRLSIWKMTLEANLNRASSLDYLVGFGRYEVVGFPVDPDKTYYGQAQFFRNHVDNAYLDILLQNGIIGFLLFFIPIVIIMRRTSFNAVSAADDHSSRQARIALGCWVGILVQMTTASVIPSFGNVINIFIFVFMAPMAVKIKPVQPTSVEEATYSHLRLGAAEDER